MSTFFSTYFDERILPSKTIQPPPVDREYHVDWEAQKVSSRMSVAYATEILYCWPTICLSYDLSGCGCIHCAFIVPTAPTSATLSAPTDYLSTIAEALGEHAFLL